MLQGTALDRFAFRFYRCRPQKGLEYRVNHGVRVDLSRLNEQFQGLGE